MTDSSAPVLWAENGPVTTITLNRPDRRNAVNAALSDALGAALDRLEEAEHLRVGIITGAGPAFCAGMDLSAFLAGEAEAILFGRFRFGGLVSRARTKPLIAAINGPALAGGLELVLACDLAIAVPDAVFGLPEPRIGLVAGAGGAMTLPHRLPRALAMRMLLTGEPIDSQAALRHGLVVALAEGDDLLAEAGRLASRIAANSPAAIKATLAASRILSSDEAAWTANDNLLREMLRSPDAAEGPAAFLGKRSPEWASPTALDRS